MDREKRIKELVKEEISKILNKLKYIIFVSISFFFNIIALKIIAIFIIMYYLINIIVSFVSMKATINEKIFKETQKEFQQQQQYSYNKWDEQFKRNYYKYKKTYDNYDDYDDYGYKKTQSQKNKNNELETAAKLLGINIIQDDMSVIKKRYHSIAKNWHPDKFSTDTKENQDIATRNFQKANNAYIIIKKYKQIK